MQSQLFPHARYFRLNGDGKWQAFPLDKYRQVTNSMVVPRNGVLELMSQTMVVAWLTDSGMESRIIRPMPCFLQNGRGTAMFTAVNKGTPQLIVQGINVLSSHRRWVLLSECPDNAKACKRKQNATASMLAKKDSLEVAAWSALLFKGPTWASKFRMC